MVAHLAGLVFACLLVLGMFAYTFWCLVSPAAAHNWFEENLVWVKVWDFGPGDDPWSKFITRAGGAIGCAFCLFVLYFLIRSMVVSVTQ